LLTLLMRIWAFCRFEAAESWDWRYWRSSEEVAVSGLKDDELNGEEEDGEGEERGAEGGLKSADGDCTEEGVVSEEDEEEPPPKKPMLSVRVGGGTLLIRRGARVEKVTGLNGQRAR
jgi:hypothetical protein